MEQTDYEKKTEGFTAIVVHPYLNPMARSVFKVADDNTGLPWMVRCREAIETRKPLYLEIEGQVFLVPLGHETFVSIVPWELFQQRMEREQLAAKLKP